MPRWELETSTRYESRLRDYVKKRPEEVKAVLSNLEKYKKALEDGAKPRKIEGGFIHPERRGVVSLDQSGFRNDLKEMRLYIYLKNQTVYLITLGDKQSQRDDIRYSHEYVKSRKGSH
jgi:hypothetical protein